jgi:Na+-driven multidrug efflux pump
VWGVCAMHVLAGEWWSWEICAGMAGTLGQTPLGAHVIIQNFSFFYFPLPFSVSMGATIRIGSACHLPVWSL